MNDSLDHVDVRDSLDVVDYALQMNSVSDSDRNVNRRHLVVINASVDGVQILRGIVDCLQNIIQKT